MESAYLALIIQAPCFLAVCIEDVVCIQKEHGIREVLRLQTWRRYCRKRANSKGGKKDTDVFHVSKRLELVILKIEGKKVRPNQKEMVGPIETGKCSILFKNAPRIRMRPGGKNVDRMFKNQINRH